MANGHVPTNANAPQIHGDLRSVCEVPPTNRSSSKAATPGVRTGDQTLSGTDVFEVRWVYFRHGVATIQHRKLVSGCCARGVSGPSKTKLTSRLSVLDEQFSSAQCFFHLISVSLLASLLTQWLGWSPNAPPPGSWLLNNWGMRPYSDPGRRTLRSPVANFGPMCLPHTSKRTSLKIL